MITLLELQRCFARRLRGESAEALAGWVEADSRGERFDIYRRNREVALRSALELSFPCVLDLVGREFFAAAAADFILAAPPRTVLLSDYGEAFPAFLRNYRPAASLPYLHDVARLEWAAARCANESTPRGAYPIGGLVMTFAPGMTLLSVDYPVAAIWRAVTSGDEAALSRIDSSRAPSVLAVWRRGAGADAAELSSAAAAFVRAVLETGDIDFALAETAYHTSDPVGLVASQILRAEFVYITQSPGGPS